MTYGAILGQTPTASNVTYNNSQTSSIITGTNVQQAIDQLFTSVSNGKAQIASAITDKGVSTSASDTFAQMAANIGQIENVIKPKTVNFSQTGAIDFYISNIIYYKNGEIVEVNDNFPEEVDAGSVLVIIFKGSSQPGGQVPRSILSSSGFTYISYVADSKLRNSITVGIIDNSESINNVNINYENIG